MKLNLLKKLLTLSPVVISPVLVTACGSNDDGGGKTDNASFYLKIYQSELSIVWQTKTQAVNQAALDFNHEYNLQTQVLSEVLTKAKAEGAAEYKKEFPNLNNYDGSNFDDITASFSIPNDSRSNLKISGSVLSVYPTDIFGGPKNKNHIDYTLALNGPKVISKSISGFLNIVLQPGFINYNASSGLEDNDVSAVFGNINLSTILVGEAGGGLDVGTRASSGGYKFDIYDTNGSGKKGKLDNDDVLSVYGNNDLSEILVGENDGGLDVGTRAKASDPYTFKNYKSTISGHTNDVSSIYGNASLSTILVGYRGFGGLSVGTKQADGNYTFFNYDGGAGKPLGGNNIGAVYGNADMSKILVGEDGTGLDVGTRKSDGKYTFVHYNSYSGAPLASAFILSLSANADMSKIFVGERNFAAGGGLDVGTRQSNGSYSFKNYPGGSGKPLANLNVTSIQGNADMSKILLGENGGGMDVGTKQADGNYSFVNYNTATSNKLTSNDVQGVFTTTDFSKILVGEDGGGIDISSNLWFA